MLRGTKRAWRFWGGLAGVLTLASLFSALPGSAATDPAMPSEPSVLGYVLLATVGLIAVGLAYLGFRDQRRYQRELAEAATRDAVLSDRLVIAGDLHDIVSHGLGAITLRARAGVRAAETDPAQATAALTDIAQLAGAATTDLRSLLTVLHDPDMGRAPTSPTAGIADIPALLDQARAAGSTVTGSGLDTHAATAGAELTAYHVVREALANTARHAGPTDVFVRLMRDDGPEGGLHVTVEDGGPAPRWTPTPGAGHGLALLARRVEAAGGSLTHGSSGAGYRVHATLPDGVAPGRQA